MGLTHTCTPPGSAACTVSLRAKQLVAERGPSRELGTSALPTPTLGATVRATPTLEGEAGSPCVCGFF